MSITDIQSIPLDIRKELSDPNIPWGISKRIFNEMKSQDATGSYKKVQVLPTDPEWRFVWRYFHKDKPNNYGIKKIYCIHEIHQQKFFEFNLSSVERKAFTFKPNWYEEPRAKQREKAIERWKQSANIFSPFSTMETDGRTRTWKNVKILPLWHGSCKEMCESVAKAGFVYFGKISLGGSISESIDEGLFGNGIYFTNSARCASDICSRGHILLAWISMREPFPIVGDPSQIDMKKIKGKGAYKTYNAHYIPVTSINPSDPYEAIYYPTKENETPHCDEFVVFNKSQTLPRFWVELEVELPYVPSDTPQCVNELIPHLTKLLQNPNVNRDQKLRNFLCRELEALLNLEENDYFEERNETMYEQLQHVLDSQGESNRRVSRALTESSQAPVTTPSPQPIQSATSALSNNLVSPQPFPPKHTIPIEPKQQSFLLSEPTDSISSQLKVQDKVCPSIPYIAFGKSEWGKYFGDIGVEPSLPANIEKVLNKSCSFWPDKKVKETHLLVLIPSTVNGELFTMSYLGWLIQKPKSGHSTKYRYYDGSAKEAVGDKSYPSHWVLMTRDIIPGSRFNSYSNCCKLINDHSKKTGFPYELPHLLDVTASILMHYVKTGDRLYNDDPWTCTYSQDVDNDNDPLVVGGFASDGLRIRNYFLSGLGVAGCWKF